MFLRLLLIGIMLPVAACHSSPLYNIPSKLGVMYLMGEQESQGMLDLIETGLLPIVKLQKEELLLPKSRAVRLKELNPKTIIVCWMPGPELHPESDDPIIAARNRWEEIKKDLDAMPEANRRCIDYLEAWPNMWGPKNIDEARWYAKYTICLARRIGEAGFKPVICTYSVGSIPATENELQILDAMAPALREAKKWNGAWAYHGYTIEYTKDISVENWHSLRYRQTYRHLRSKHADIADFPIILSEGGVDKEGNPDTDGWQARGDAKKYTDWLLWYDKEIRQDPEVLGVTLFKIGSHTIWKSFDLEPIACWLKGYLEGRSANVTELN